MCRCGGSRVLACDIHVRVNEIGVEGGDIGTALDVDQAVGHVAGLEEMHLGAAFEGLMRALLVQAVIFPDRTVACGRCAEIRALGLNRGDMARHDAGGGR